VDSVDVSRQTRILGKFLAALAACVDTRISRSN